MNDSIRNEKTICMAYCRNAIMSPTCMLPSATWWLPTQMMASVTPFMTSIMSGIMKAMTRLTNSIVLVRSVLALSKRFSSNSCRLNARITIMPDRFSRITRFSRSIRVCIRRNRGITIENTVRIRPMITTTASAMIHHMDRSLLTARMMPPTAMIGA